MAEKWTKTSALPSSGVMKPKPFSPLNHFTVPCAMSLSSIRGLPRRSPVQEHRVADRTHSGSCPAHTGPGRRPRAPDNADPMTLGLNAARGGYGDCNPRHATTLWREGNSAERTFRPLHDIREQHGPGHRAHTAGHGREPRRHVAHGRVDVADEPCLACRLVD